MLRSYQYQFDLDLSRVHLEIPFACAVELWWRKGNKKITTKRRVELTGRERWFEVGERLSMVATCHCDGGGFAAKPSIVNVVIVTANNPNKSGGYHSLELTDVLQGSNPLNPSTRNYDVGIQNCPTANGRLQFSLSARCLQEVHGNQSFEAGGLNTPTRNHSIDMTFRADEPEGFGLNSSGKADLDFSFQQVPFTKNPQQQHQRQFQGNATTPVAQPVKSVDSEAFYQLLETKRKLDERNMQFARLHNDFILQMEKLRQLESDSKHREVRMMNDANILNEEVNRLRKQLNQQSAAFAEQTVLAARSKEELKRAELTSQKLDQLQSEVYRKQAEMISIENAMSNRLKEAVANNEKLTETINNLNSQLRSNYEKLRELERQKVQHETHGLRDKEAGELKIRALEEKAKEKDAIIDAVRKDFEKFSSEKTEFIRRLKDAEESNRTLTQQLAISARELQLVKNEQQAKQTESAAFVKEVELQKNKLKLEHDYVVEELIGRIKSLEEALEAKSVALADKQQLMDKAKDYVNFKEEEIQRRDQFIARAKEYLQDKEAQLAAAKGQLAKHDETITGLKATLADKDNKVKQLQVKLSAATTESTTSLIELRTEKEAYLKRQQELTEQLHRSKESEERLLSEINTKAAYCIQMQFESQEALMKVKALEQQLQCRTQQLYQLQQQLCEGDSEHESFSKQMQQRLQETLKQNAQYLIQINIYAREVKNMQELLERAEKKLLRLEERDRSTIAPSLSREPLKENGQDRSLDSSKYASFVGEDSAPNSRVA